MSFGEGDLHERVDQLQKANELLRKSEIRKMARIDALERSLNDVAGKWAEAQVDAEDCAKRCNLLESLVLDLYADLRRITEGGRKLEYETRMEALGLMGR